MLVKANKNYVGNKNNKTSLLLKYNK
jgi:hypothetical protein